MSDFSNKKCVPCEGDVATLSRQQAEELLKNTPGWELHEVAPSSFAGHKSHLQIEREYRFKNFSGALEFINRIAKIAEENGHHPDMLLYGWNKVHLTFTTHAIGGLSENDFIMAAKINTL